MFSPANPISNRTPLLSLVRIFLVLLLGFLIVGPLIGAAVAMEIYHGDFLKDVTQAVLDPALRMPMLIMQGFASFMGLIVLPVIYITFLERKPVSMFFAREENLGMMLLIVAAIGIAFPIAMSPITIWNMNWQFPEFMSGIEQWAQQQEKQHTAMTDLMLNIHSTTDLVFALFVIGLLAGIGEELVFRGLIQQELWRASGNIHLAIWLSAFIFSAIHFQFYGFVPRVLLGALFGYMYYWSGNLLIPILGHFCNNSFAVIMVYLNNIQVTNLDIEGKEAPPVGLIIGCIIASAALLYYTHKHYRAIRAV